MNRILSLTLLLLLSSSVAAASFSSRGHAEVRHQQRAGNPDGEPLKQRYQALLEGQLSNGRLTARAIALGRYRSQYNQASTAPEVRDEMRHDAELREYFLSWSGDTFELRAGKQQQAWGRADYFRIVDVWNPLDLREFLLPYFDNYSLGRQPRGMLIGDYFASQWEHQLVIAPQAKTTRLAPAGSDFALSAMPAQLPPQQQPDKPVDVGWRGKTFWSGNDIELYAFLGYQPDVLLHLDQGKPFRRQTRRSMLGASLARPWGAWVIRSDLAYYPDESRQSGSAIEHSRRSRALIGLDRVANEWSWNLQLANSHWYDRQPGHDDVWESSLALEKNWSRYRLSSGVLWLVNHVDNHHGQTSQLWRLTLSYEFLPQWKISAAALAFDGKNNTQFGQFDDQDRVYLSLRRDFSF